MIGRAPRAGGDCANFVQPSLANCGVRRRVPRENSMKMKERLAPGVSSMDRSQVPTGLLAACRTWQPLATNGSGPQKRRRPQVLGLAQVRSVLSRFRTFAPSSTLADDTAVHGEGHKRYESEGIGLPADVRRDVWDPRLLTVPSDNGLERSTELQGGRTT